MRMAAIFQPSEESGGAKSDKQAMLVGASLILLSEKLKSATFCVLAPIAERLFVAINVQLGDTALQLFLRIMDRSVVDQRPDFFEEEVQQRLGLQVAGLGIEVVAQIALNRGDGFLLQYLLELDGHDVCFLSVMMLCAAGALL